MRDYLITIPLVLLIFAATLTLCRCSVGQSFESARDSQKVRTNDRRASGLVPYPRIGRNSDMTNFARTDRAAGLVHYPRVGRADLPISNINVNRYHDLEPDTDFDFYPSHDNDQDALLEFDYEGYFAGKPTSYRHVDKFPRDGAWVAPERVRGVKEYRTAQKNEDPRVVHPNVRGSRNGHGQSELAGYTPRLGHENDHDGGMNFL